MIFDEFNVHGNSSAQRLFCSLISRGKSLPIFHFAEGGLLQECKIGFLAIGKNMEDQSCGFYKRLS